MVALVITIVVLSILAGVSINTVVGDDGIIIKAQNSADLTKESEAKEIINNYKKTIEERSYDKDVLGEANCYDEIYKQPNRKKCALLPYEGVKKILEGDK